MLNKYENVENFENVENVKQCRKCRKIVKNSLKDSNFDGESIGATFDAAARHNHQLSLIGGVLRDLGGWSVAEENSEVEVNSA